MRIEPPPRTAAGTDPPRQERLPHVEALTDPGPRPANEDAWAVLTPREADESCQVGMVCLVVDGVGGQNGGERASHLAVETVDRVYFADRQPDREAALWSALQEASASVHREGMATPHLAGMATTVVAALVRGLDIDLLWAGDSRGYLIRSSDVRRLTDDHTLVAELVREGRLTAEEAAVHAERHVITRSIGGAPSVELGRTGVRIGPGDAVLLCSDGLTDVLSDTEIGAAVRGSPPHRAVRQLVNLAKRRGTTDNVTAMVIAHPDGRRYARRSLRALVLGAAAVGALSGLVALAALGAAPAADHRAAPTIESTDQAGALTAPDAAAADPPTASPNEVSVVVMAPPPAPAPERPSPTVEAEAPVGVGILPTPTGLPLVDPPREPVPPAARAPAPVPPSGAARGATVVTPRQPEPRPAATPAPPATSPPAAVTPTSTPPAPASSGGVVAAPNRVPLMAAPVALEPRSGSSVDEGATLMWRWDRPLAPDEVYAVSIAPAAGPARPMFANTTATSFTVPGDVLAPGSTIAWTVHVQRGSAEVSVRSAPWTVSRRGGAGTGGRGAG
jgi:protein phosphatase